MDGVERWLTGDAQIVDDKCINILSDDSKAFLSKSMGSDSRGIDVGIARTISVVKRMSKLAIAQK